ncbi:lactonase family protein [Cesiribacter andamanensis]|uniref:6-phosphogluconolactonase n=1 Tax=Cesiribacter andamanensis AMV16 TaxID=1279009 RepID=M7NJL5_9BACT|nr:lactonase family protein [Cesiribacter andamanensis]EMR01990.1 hypothetical protein ADICEAN_02882 [Cesiribacter andamanensis AMV16]
MTCKTLFVALLPALLMAACSSAPQETAAPETTAMNTAPSAQAYRLLVGTYTSGKSEGIYVFALDAQNGTLSPLDTARGVSNPSFLKASPDGRHLYAVNEHSGDQEGMVSAFRWENGSGRLDFLNQQPSGGGDPCYLNVSPDGRHLLVANYTGGSIGVLPIEGEGRLGAPVQVVQHQGSSQNKERQEKPHVHSVVLSPNGQHLLAGDLGTDKINLYTFSGRAEQPLTPADPPFVAVEAGTGPRHLIFGPSGQYVYLVQELSGSMAVYRWNEGTPELMQTISMTAPDFTGKVSGAEVRISPDGRFLYASNRGDANEIVIYAINAADGSLSLVGRQPSGGKTPRNFVIDPSGRWLLVAHQDSDSIVVFARDAESGKLRATDTKIEVSKPVYLLLLPAENS